MKAEELIRLLFSLLGGGLAVGILNWIRLNSSEQRERKINNLTQKMERLYGPLYYFVCQNQKLFELNKRWDDAYRAEYIDKEWNTDFSAHEALSKEADEVIKLRNEYIAEVENNNQEIKEIFNKGYPFIDSDDIDIFTLFYEHYIRAKKEVGDDKKLNRLTMRCYIKVGDISFLRPEFINRIKEKFEKKKSEIEELSKNSKSIDKFFAKEGLIFLALVGGGSALIVGAKSFRPTLCEIYKNTTVSIFPYGILVLIGKLLILVYLVYLIALFVVWAIKIIRTNEEL